jgi:hypothetical protein
MGSGLVLWPLSLGAFPRIRYETNIQPRSAIGNILFSLITAGDSTNIRLWLERPVEPRVTLRCALALIPLQTT